jgi:hypothetical protein
MYLLTADGLHWVAVVQYTNFKLFCTVHPFNIRNEKPTDVTIPILFIFRRISTCFGPTGPSSGKFTQLFTQPLVQWLYRSGRVLCILWLVLVTVLYWRTVTKTSHKIQSTRPERYSHWTNSCVNSCVNYPEDGPVGPKHVEIRRNMNKIGIVTSVGFSFHMYSTHLHTNNTQNDTMKQNTRTVNT